ncbi:hypothetical protein HELRODRAFT_182835 [Helobdella robusta]|uniref:acid phosphatase n=1 Tax=Helobdella robusta TaxID=6412 RepID=T1FIU2_HELRO|nr:hypothetical protein HELRODRAFT_182835 [Helobdella robusta]ESN90045.1 hypothetical protein HELRODRAFT_182835 [Helobdella robusta]
MDRDPFDYGLLNGVNSGFNRISGSDENSVKFSESKPRSDFTRMCNVSKYYDPNENERLSSLTSKYLLHSIVVVMRHGVRAPLSFVHSSFEDGSNVGEKPTCSLKPKENLLDKKIIKRINSIKKLAGSLSSNEPPLVRASAFPNTERCDVGQLTAKGARQMYLLGSLFNGKYSQLLRNVFLDSNQKHHIFAQTTYYLRTYQSAMAFLAGFFGNFTKVLKSLHLKSSNLTSTQQQNYKLLHLSLLDNIYHCDDHFKSTNKYFCSCSSAVNIPDKIKNKMDGLPVASKKVPGITSLIESSKKIRKELFGASMSLGNVIEIISSYVCFDLHLPCYLVEK